MLEVGLAVRIVREAKRIKLTELAGKAGVSAPFLSLIESGQRDPSLAVIRRLAEALSVPSEVLILLAQSGTSLRSSDSSVERLAASVRRLARAEQELRTLLESEAPARGA